MSDFAYLDVCSGYSAASIAFSGFDWRSAGYAEIDPFASALLAHHYGATAPMRMPDPDEEGIAAKERKHRAVALKNIPNYHWGDRVPNFGNFTTIGRDDVGSVQLLIGGTPCQSFSQAGKRHGLDDPRGNLTLEFLALAERLQPRWLAWENVPGFLSQDGGRTAGTFFGLLGQLGYGWAYRVLDAQFIRVDGLERAVPQRRRRIIVVGCLGNATAAAAVLFERESLRGDPRPRRRTAEDVAPTLRSSAGKRGGTQDEASASGLIAARMLAFGEYEIDDIASTMKARDFKDPTDLILGPRQIAASPVAPTLPAGANQTGGDRPPGSGQETAESLICIPPVADTLVAGGKNAGWQTDDRNFVPVAPDDVVPFDTTQLTSPHNGSNPQMGDPCHALAANAHPPAVAFKPSHYTRDKDGAPTEIAPPLTADTDKGDQDTVILTREIITFDADQDPIPNVDVAGSLRTSRSQAQAVCIHADAIGRDGKAKTDSPDAEGRMRKRDAGLGVSEDASFNLTTGAPHAVAVPEGDAFTFQSRIARNDRGQPDDVAPALNGVNAGDTSDMRPIVAQPLADGWKVRRLTPIECERLQGVPDFYTHIEMKRRQRSSFKGPMAGFDTYWLSQRPDLTEEQLMHLCADAPRYRVLGNSFSTNFIRWVGWGIKVVDEAVFVEGEN